MSDVINCLLFFFLSRDNDKIQFSISFFLLSTWQKSNSSGSYYKTGVNRVLVAQSLSFCDVSGLINYNSLVVSFLQISLISFGDCGLLLLAIDIVISTSSYYH